MKIRRYLSRVAPIAAATVLLTAGAAAAAIAPVSRDAAGAAALANAMAVDPSLVTSASFVAVPPSGTPHGTSTTLNAFPTNGSTFAIMTTGAVSLADDPNSAQDSGASLGGGPVRGNTDRDVTILALGLKVPTGANCLTFDFKFLSEEYPEWVGKEFNDAFIAELDASTWSTNGNAISAPKNFAFDPSGNVISINSTGSTAMNPANAAGTTYDGATPLLSAATQVPLEAASLVPTTSTVTVCTARERPLNVNERADAVGL
jgi:hypothetical protein